MAKTGRLLYAAGWPNGNAGRKGRRVVDGGISGAGRRWRKSGCSLPAAVFSYQAEQEGHKGDAALLDDDEGMAGDAPVDGDENYVAQQELHPEPVARNPHGKEEKDGKKPVVDA